MERSTTPPRMEKPTRKPRARVKKTIELSPDAEALLSETAERTGIPQGRLLEELVLRYAGRVEVVYPPPGRPATSKRKT